MDANERFYKATNRVGFVILDSEFPLLPIFQFFFLIHLTTHIRSNDDVIFDCNYQCTCCINIYMYVNDGRVREYMIPPHCSRKVGFHKREGKNPAYESVNQFFLILFFGHEKQPFSND